MSIIKYKRIPSTNAKAKALAQDSAPEWTIVVSDTQTRGRGRMGRKWESQKGGLWFSVILRPIIPAGNVPVLQFLASNATRQAVYERTAVRAWTKWPNDLVLESKKLAGILVESKSEGDSVCFAVVGIGLNVNQRTGELPTGATSLYEVSGRKYRLNHLLEEIIKNMKKEYRRLKHPIEILDEWWRNCIHRSRQVQVKTRSGVVKGITTGIDLDGSLLLETGEHVLERLVEGTLRPLSGNSNGHPSAFNALKLAALHNKPTPARFRQK